MIVVRNQVMHGWSNCLELGSRVQNLPLTKLHSLGGNPDKLFEIQTVIILIIAVFLLKSLL